MIMKGDQIKKRVTVVVPGPSSWPSGGTYGVVINDLQLIEQVNSVIVDDPHFGNSAETVYALKFALDGAVKNKVNITLYKLDLSQTSPAWALVTSGDFSGYKFTIDVEGY